MDHRPPAIESLARVPAVTSRLPDPVTLRSRADVPALRSGAAAEAAPARGQEPFGMASMVEANIWRRLYENRILYLRGPIEDTIADTLVAQLMSLDAESDKDVTLYINSPGGLVSGMFAVYDVVNLMRAKVNTVCVGMAASAGAFLLATPTGSRSATENARIMIHQPLGGARGQAVDIQIQARQIAFMRNRLNEILAEKTGQPLDRIEKDTDRDFWLSAPEAVEYGLIDEVRATDRGI